MSKTFRILAFASAIALLGGCSTERGDGTKPAGVALDGATGASGYNLLLITVDTLRADHLGCYGDGEARTPAIDALAEHGVRFESAVCSVPLTLPSHTSIMTGLDPPHHGVRHNGTFHLGDGPPTLAEALRGAGYATAAFVGAFVLDRRYGLGRGFEHYDDTVHGLDEAPSIGRFNERPANEVSDAAMAWLRGHLEQDPDRPFMVWVHYFDPHAPYAAPGEYGTRFATRPYDGEIAFTDAQIGRLLDFLRQRGLLDRTLVVFTADHGEGLGAHDEPTHGDLIYDATLRVPLILSNPSLFPAPRVVADRLAASIDILPTTLGLLGVALAAPVDGRDVLGASPDAERAVYVETLAPLLDYGWSALHGLRRLRDKFILAPTPEYYDLRSDPGELHNLYAGGQATALESELGRRMAGETPDLEVLQSELQPEAEELARLASLGYVRDQQHESRPGVKDPKEMVGLQHRMQHASELSLAGDDDAAIEEIRAVLEQDPGSGKAWYTAVQIYDRAGRPDDAEDAVGRALALSPRVEGWIMLARYSLNRGDVETFERALDEAARLDPHHGGIYIGRGHALAMQGKLEQARAEFEKAIEVDPARSGDYARKQIALIDSVLARH